MKTDPALQENKDEVVLPATGQDRTARSQTELALAGSADFTSSLIRSMQDGFSVVDVDGIQMAVNPALCRMTGFTEEELIGIPPPFPYWPPEELGKIQTAFTETLKGNGGDFELMFLRKNGERFPVIVSSSSVQNAEGTKVSFLATVKDITARKKAEMELAHTADLLERTGAMAKIGGWELELHPQKLFWSLETCRLFDIDASVAPPLEQAVAFYAPEERSKIKAAIQAAIENGTSYDLELRVISAKGRCFWARSQGSPVLEDGIVTKLIGTFQDITERKQAEIKYLQELKFNETLLDHTSVIMVLLDRQARMVHVNQATVDILGFSRRELLGKTPWELGIMSSEEKVRAIERFQVLLKGGSNPPRETVLTARNGDDHLFSLSSLSIRANDGSIDRIIVTGADLTERNRLQKELLNIAEQEQARIGHNLHDGVGQTLTGVASLMDALQFELTGEPLRSAQRIRQLIDEAIQEVRRMSHGLSPSAVKNRGLAGALQLLADTIRINHRTACELHMDTDIELADLETQTHIYRIAQEACNNAIRHGKPSQISISLHRIGERECVLKVENDGTRIAESKSEGIGLQIMDYRANLIGGTLKIASKVKRGVSVTCRFPCKPKWLAPA
jgi:PAS domain S-box-containing protein